MKNKIVHIDLGPQSYNITIASEAIENLISALPFNVSGRKAFIVTDVNVEPYAKQVSKLLKNSGARFADIVVLPAGEATKSYESLQRVQSWMLENNIHRDSIVFAVGGGVIGDLAGFAAATVMRGVAYVQIPTTLLSQVDSSVGGKTGINTPAGKNLVGAFHQPHAVIADIATLKTLPRRELLAGYAEIVKYGLLGDAGFFEWLEEQGESVCNLDEGNLVRAIEISCSAKAAIVEEDEREKGRRALLNLGHTFGHALEAAAGYDGRLLHGEAVAMGMVMAFDASIRLGLCPEGDLLRVLNHFKAVGLPVSPSLLWPDADYDFYESLIETMKKDKKASDEQMIFVLVRGIGDAFIHKGLSRDMILDVLRSAFARG